MAKEQFYLFSCPDGFQRIANYQKLKFQKVKVVFVPSIQPDHFGGFPGFFLSSRESKNDSELDFQRTILICPKNTAKLLEKSISFMGEYWHDLQIVEIPENLDSELMVVDEESKDSELSY